ncbi:MAG: hypothetical protein ACQCN5_08625 [Candidatus Bathyarchaeia archaeon]
MIKLVKLITLLLLAVLTTSSLIITNASAQSIPKPSVPKFKVELVDHSYDIAPTSTTNTNPFNNKTTTIVTPGQHVTVISIDIIIENQHISNTQFNGYNINLYYNVRVKGHYAQNWAELYPYTNKSPEKLVLQSNTAHTIIPFPRYYNMSYIEIGDQVDFQVEAVLGYISKYSGSDPNHPLMPIFGEDFNFVSSDWSSTVTFKMPDTSNAIKPSTQEAYATSVIPEFQSQTELTLVALIIIAMATIIITKQKRVHS